jgi:trehalose/maltose hydrolase-like predicted phosphorylase
MKPPSETMAPASTRASFPSLNWSDADDWLLEVDPDHLANFIRPYTGNGLLGVKLGELVAFSEDPEPLLVLSKIIFDIGHHKALPEWHRLEMSIGGRPYALSGGQHHARHVMDLRTGAVSLHDVWEYAPGRTVEIRLTLSLYRSFKHGASVVLDVSGATEPVKLTFGLRAGSVVRSSYDLRFESTTDTSLTGFYQTLQQRRNVAQGLTWKTSGLTTRITPASDDGMLVVAESQAGDCRLELFHAFHSYADGPDPVKRVQADLRYLQKTGCAALERKNLEAWKPFWARALDFRALGERERKDVLIHQFYLLASLDEGLNPLGAMGLSHMAWRGNTLWDADLWMFRAVLPLWPELARAMLCFRRATLGAAYDNARRLGYGGACYPWSADENGQERAAHIYHYQHHVGIWIVMGFREYHQATGDLDFLREEGWPVVKGIADFWVSRTVLEADGRRHIRGVLGPDEAVAETGPGVCDDHYLTNLGAVHVLRWATEMAGLIGETAPSEWATVQREIFVPQPGKNGIIPEFAGYRGEAIKQADVILSFYLFDHGLDADTVQRNIAYYHDKIQATGPLMNSQIEACIALREKPETKAVRQLFADYEPFIRGAYRQTFECLPESNRNAVFLTAPAGLLQALVFGYYGQTIGQPNGFPTVGDHWSQ